MAPNATIFKALLHIADVERHYYEDHTVTLAQHPSETDERMMVRLLAFAMHAHEALSFGRGLSTEDEPALWQKDLTGIIELWIEVGLPDEKALRRDEPLAGGKPGSGRACAAQHGTALHHSRRAAVDRRRDECRAD